MFIIIEAVHRCHQLAHSLLQNCSAQYAQMPPRSNKQVQQSHLNDTTFINAHSQRAYLYLQLFFFTFIPTGLYMCLWPDLCAFKNLYVLTAFVSECLLYTRGSV